MLYDKKKWDKELPVNTDGFMTARQLGLTKAEYEALVKTLGRFERGKIPPLLFDMDIIGHPECGAAGCICGWARLGDQELFQQWLVRGVQKLFIIPRVYKEYSPTPQHAAVAIRNYLMTADPKWAEVYEQSYKSA